MIPPTKVTQSAKRTFTQFVEFIELLGLTQRTQQTQETQQTLTFRYALRAMLYACLKVRFIFGRPILVRLFGFDLPFVIEFLQGLFIRIHQPPEHLLVLPLLNFFHHNA